MEDVQTVVKDTYEFKYDRKTKYLNVTAFYKQFDVAFKSIRNRVYFKKIEEDVQAHQIEGPIAIQN